MSPQPSVLLLTNHATDDSCPGAPQALSELVDRGELGGYRVLNSGPAAHEPRDSRERRVIQAVRASNCDIVLVQSMKDSIRNMDAVASALAGRPVLYWEGDPWGRGKSITPAMAAWLDLSTVVFSVGGDPQASLLRANGARDVRFIVHTYDHVLFSESERNFTFEQAIPGRVGVIGSNLMRAPLISGLPGSWQRFHLVARLRRVIPDLALAGPGWPRGWSQGRLPFEQQADFVRSCGVLANWDHYPRTSGYTSDRMAITMIAGRAQVTTKHPGMQWASDCAGVHFYDNVRSAVEATLSLGSNSMDELRELGFAAHQWAKGRLSHRQAYRFMVSTLVDSVSPPDEPPWTQLPSI